jgi:hypothetical protein
VGFYRTTISSSANESDSLAEEPIVFRQFTTRFIFRSIPEYLHNTCYRGTFNMASMVVFRKEKLLYVERNWI